MSTASSHSTLARGTQESGEANVDTALQKGPYHGPRPPDSELEALRGIGFALMLVLPFWLLIAWVVAALL